MRKPLSAVVLLLAMLAPVLAACGTPTGGTGGTSATTAPPAGGSNAVTAEAETAAPATAATTAPAATTATQATSAPATTSAPAATADAAATSGPAATSASGSGASIKVGLVTDVGKINDGTFNQFAYEGLKRAESELGVEINYIETQAQTDYGKNIDQFASQGYNMIIGVGFLMGDAIKEASAKYPNIKFAIVDSAYDPPLSNVEALVFAEDEAGYLAGALAAQISKSGTVAAVGGIEIPPVQRFLLGFENGAKSINPDIQVKRVFIDSFTDRARGAEAARSFIAEGADVIFGAGGQTGSGAIQAAAQDGVFVIGVDQDEYLTTFQRGAAPGADKIVSSAQKRVDVAVFNAIKTAVDGTFKGGTVLFNAANDGVGLAEAHDAAATITPEIKAQLDKIQQGLADGSIKTNVTLP